MVNTLEIFNHVQQDAYQKDNHQNPPIFSQPVHAYFLLQNHSSGDELFHDTLIHTGKSLQVGSVHTFINFMNSGINKAEFHHLRPHASNKAPVGRSPVVSSCGLISL